MDSESELYRSIVEDQTEFIVRWLPDGTRTFVNEAYCRAFGGTAEEHTGTSFFPLIAPEDLEAVKARLERITPESPVSTAEHRVLLPDGSVGWQQWTDRGTFDEEGRIVEMQSVGRDVTERRRAQQEVARQVAHQSLIARLSSRLLMADPSSMSEPIQEALAAIGAAHDIDYCRGWWFEHKGAWHQPYLWAAESVRGEVSEWPRTVAVDDVSWASEKILARESFWFERPEDMPPEAADVRAVQESHGIGASAFFPVLYQEDLVGAFELGTVHRSCAWDERELAEMKALGEVVSTAYARAHARRKLADREGQLERALAEVQELKDRLEVENVYLREEVRQARGPDTIVGESLALRRCLRLVERVAPTDATVLIVGETGTGKERVARTLHDLSRRNGPLVSINCAALPANLVESELFGYEKGAFTGAATRKLGRLELASRGTLFLDEIGELPLEVQAKLLRVLQEGEFQRLGGVDTLTFDGRIVAATNRELEAAVARGDFRGDLYYRLNVFPIELPALKERREDIPALARHFAEKHGPSLGRPVTGLSSRLMEHLTSRSWPGNIRELESFIQRALIVGEGPELDLDDLVADESGEILAHRSAGGSLEDVERQHVTRTLEETDWVIEGEEGAARRLGLAPSTLRSRMKKLGIRRG